MLQKIVEERELSVKKRMIFKLGMMSSVAAAGQSASAIGKGSAGTTAKPTISAFEAINNSRPRNLNRASLTLEARKRQPRAQGGMFGAMRGYLGLNNPSGSRREALKAKLQEQDKLDEDRINITQQIFIPKSVTLPVPKIEKYMTMTDAVIRLKNHSEGSKLVLVSGFPKQVDEAVELLKNFVGTLCDIGFFRFGARIRTNLDGKTGEILAQTTELPPNEGTNALEVFNREIRSKNSSSKNIPETKKKDLRNLTTTELIQRHKMKQLAAKKQQKSDSAESSAGHHRTGGKSASKTTSSETEMVSEEVETPSKTALTRSRSGNSIISIGSNNSSILEISSDEEVPSLPKIPKMEETSNSESMGADRGSEDF